MLCVHLWFIMIGTVGNTRKKVTGRLCSNKSVAQSIPEC